MLQNHVISLTTAHERRTHITNEFAKHNIPFDFFDAVTPGDRLNQVITQFAPGLINQPKLSLGEKACFMSHVLLWHKCVEDNLPYMAIYEDDIILGQDSGTLLSDDSWIKERFSALNTPYIIRTETFLMKVGTKASNIASISLNNEKDSEVSYSLDILTSRHYGTAGYIISNATARKFLARISQLPSHLFNPLDHFMFRDYVDDIQFATVYQLNPGICVQEMLIQKNHSRLGSDIEKERSSNRKQNKDKLDPLAKLLREIKKIPDAIRKLSYQEIPFK